MDNKRLSKFFAILTYFGLAASLLLGLFDNRQARAVDPGYPSSMVALGSSTTAAKNLSNALPGEHPEYSWAAPLNYQSGSLLSNSFYNRIKSQNPAMENNEENYAVSGAKMINLIDQINSAIGRQPEFATILIGVNDACTPTEAEMTAVADFKQQFSDALSTLLFSLPNIRIYVVSLNNIYNVWQIFHNDSTARSKWSSNQTCQSMLANPTSTAQDDVDRRNRVNQRFIDYNNALKEVCDLLPRCRFDNSAFFNVNNVATDFSNLDYFHPSVSGQQKLADTAWNAGFDFSDTTPPTTNSSVTGSGGNYQLNLNATDNKGVKMIQYKVGNTDSWTIYTGPISFQTTDPIISFRAVDVNANIEDIKTFNPATYTLGPPSLGKAFGAASVQVNGSTSLTFTISNTNAGATLSGINFSDSFPAGLKVAASPGLTNNCGGSVTIAGTNDKVDVAGVSLAATVSCTISLTVVGTGQGLITNTVNKITANESGAASGSPATATLNVTTASLKSISIFPVGATVGIGATRQLTATGTYSDNTVQDITSSVSWSSSTPGVATVANTGSNKGLATGVSVGTTTVTATLSGVTGSTLLSVSANSTGLAYYPLPKPIRILDTRTVANTATDGYYNPNNNPNNPNGVGSISTLAADATLTLKLAGITYNGVTIPSQAQAIEGDTQVAAPGAAGFLSLYPAGSLRPVTASMLFNQGQFLANSVTLTLGSNGGVSIYSSTQTNVLLDISGYYAPVGTPDPNNLDGQGQPRTDTGLLYFPLSKPVRLLDTRKVANTATDGYYNPNNNPNNPNGVGTVGTFASGATKNFKVSGISYNGQSIPSSAKALVGNIQVAAPPAAGFLTVYPGGTTRPVAATMLYNPAQFLANAVNLTVATDGTIAIYAFAQSDILLDVTGYFAPASSTTGGLSYNPLSKPVRLLDTRTVANPATDGYYNPNNNPNNPNGVGTVGTFANGATKSFKVGGITYNSQTIPTSAKALVGNIQVAAPPGVGFLTAYPGPADASGANRPVAATMLYNPGQFLANSVVLTVDTGGIINLYTFASTNLLLDASGYFS